MGCLVVGLLEDDELIMGEALSRALGDRLDCRLCVCVCDEKRGRGRQRRRSRDGGAQHGGGKRRTRVPDKMRTRYRVLERTRTRDTVHVM